MAPPSVRTATFGEGDGPDQVQNFLSVTTPAADTIANLDVEMDFASTVSLVGMGVDVSDGLRVTARGVLSTAAAPPTLQMKLKHSVGADMCVAAALAVSANLVNRGWHMEALLIPTVNNSEAEAQGMLMIGGSTNPVRDMKNASRVGTAQSGVLSISALWSVADPSNSITLRQFTVERVQAP